MILFDIAYKTSLEKDYLRHHQNICDNQIRFNAYDSIRFERPYLIISFDLLRSFFRSEIEFQIDVEYSNALTAIITSIFIQITSFLNARNDKIS